MNYSDDLPTNERLKIAKGERTKLTWPQLDLFLGETTQPFGELVELLLDIVNDQYPADDFIKEAQTHWAQYNEEV